MPDSWEKSLKKSCRICMPGAGDLFVTALNEDYGLTPLEAMASGKPVIAVSGEELRETITPGTGLLVPPNIEALIFALQTIGNDPSIYRTACESRAKNLILLRFSQSFKTTVKGGEDMGIESKSSFTEIEIFS